MASPRLSALQAELSQAPPAVAPQFDAPAAEVGDPLLEAVALLEPLAEGDEKVQQALDLLREASGGEVEPEVGEDPADFEEDLEDE